MYSAYTSSYHRRRVDGSSSACMYVSNEMLLLVTVRLFLLVPRVTNLHCPTANTQLPSPEGSNPPPIPHRVAAVSAPATGSICTRVRYRI